MRTKPVGATWGASLLFLGHFAVAGRIFIAEIRQSASEIYLAVKLDLIESGRESSWDYLQHLTFFLLLIFYTPPVTQNDYR